MADLGSVTSARPLRDPIHCFKMFYKSTAFWNIDIKFNIGQISVILSYFSFYIYFICYFVQDM